MSWLAESKASERLDRVSDQPGLGRRDDDDETGGDGVGVGRWETVAADARAAISSIGINQAAAPTRRGERFMMGSNGRRLLWRWLRCCSAAGLRLLRCGRTPPAAHPHSRPTPDQSIHFAGQLHSSSTPAVKANCNLGWESSGIGVRARVRRRGARVAAVRANERPVSMESNTTTHSGDQRESMEGEKGRRGREANTTARRDPVATAPARRTAITLHN